LWYWYRGIPTSLFVLAETSQLGFVRLQLFQHCVNIDKSHWLANYSYCTILNDPGCFENLSFSLPGMAVSIWLLSTKLKLSDPLIGIISGVSNMCACISYAFSYTSLAMYLCKEVILFRIEIELFIVIDSIFQFNLIFFNFLNFNCSICY